MKFDIEEVSPVLRRVSFEIPAKHVDQLFSESYRQIGQQARIKGFRPGKIPRKVLEQLPRYRSVVHEDVTKRLHEESIQELLDKSDLHILALPKSDNGELKSGKDYNFSIDVEILPVLDLAGVEEHTVPFEKVAISDEDVDNAIEQERQRMATLESVTERGAEEGDRLKVNYTVKEEGEEDDVVNDQMIWLGRGMLPKPVQDALVGIKVGETREVEHVEEADAEDEESKSRTQQYVVTVNEIQAQILPEIDDEMARDAEYDDLASMRESLREKLQTTEDKQSDERSREKMLDLIISEYEIPIPPTYLENHIDKKAQNMAYQLRAMTNNQIEIDPVNLRGGVRNEAQKELQVAIIVQQIARENEIEVSDEEIDAELERIAAAQNRTVAYLKSMYGERERDALSSDVKQRKAIDLLWERLPHAEQTLSKAERDELIAQEQQQKYAQEDEVEEEEFAQIEHEHTHGHDCGHDHSHDHNHNHK